MTERIWDDFLTERDKQVFDRSGYGTLGGFGRRPAVLMIDMTYDFVGDKPEPVLESIKRWPNSSGEEGWEAIAVIETVIARAREKNLPLFYTKPGIRPDGWDWGSWHWKSSRIEEWLREPTNDFDGNRIVAQLAPTARDIVIPKHKPSAFFGTPLMLMLTQLGADSLIVTGCTTSGCVRASVVDAFSYNLRVAVVEEGCFDRAQASHAMTLCDLNAKYADVLPAAEILAHIDILPQDLFALPSGSPPPLPA